MKPYLVIYNFYYDGKLEGVHTSTQLLESPHNEEHSGTDFDSLWDFAYKWSVILPLNMWEFKKGKRFLELYNKTFSHITPKNCKPWKFTITSAETTISMERLMKFDTEDVIQYLKERGMTTCPMVK